MTGFGRAIIVLFLASAALLSTTGRSEAQLVTVAELDTGYVYCPACDPTFFDPEELESLFIVGWVGSFLSPLDDLNAAPHPEYTYVFRDLDRTSWGMWDDFENDRGGFFAEYGGGVLEIRSDRSTGARLEDPATFLDGTLLLRAEFSGFVIGMWPDTQSGALQVTGGTLFDRLSRDGVGYTGESRGLLWTEAYWSAPFPYGDLGYVADSVSRIDLDIPTPVRTTTWGRLKRQYDQAR